MKRTTLFCCTLLLGLAVCACTLSVSAKVKHDTINKYSLTVDDSRGTFIPQAISKDRLPSYFSFVVYQEVQNDPYLERSQRWIKSNNLEATRRITETDISPGQLYLNC